MNSKWKHNALQHDLAEHLAAPGKMLWEDMQLGPAGSPRPDVYTMQKSFAKPKPLAYEIKVSVSDFRSDVTSGKWQSYLDYAAGVYFAVPAGLISKSDLPTGCGLIVRGDESWRVVKAPTLQAVELPGSAYLKLLIDGIERDRREQRHRTGREWLSTKEANKVLGEEVAAALQDVELLRYEKERLEQEIENRRQAALRRAEMITENAKQNAERFSREANESVAELCEVLGIPFESSPFAVRRAINEVRNSLDRDEMVCQMRRALKQVEMATSTARNVIGEVE